ncbi:MAG: ornithine carbamoyltransferase [Methanobacteriota archaeon]|nr:MAG: ornithine carbamoyltransferase [Euryarchaeota archaeon]
MVSHLLAIDDLTDDLRAVLDWAITFKRDLDIAPEFTPLAGLAVGSIYEKPSTRTRVSFEVGISRLGGHPLTLLKNDIQLGGSESVSDTAKVLSRYLAAITYRCFAHADVEELAAHSDVPVINALSDTHHPCQAAADLMTIMERFDDLDEVHIAYVGDGNNVLHDLMLGAAILGCDISWATPAGHEPSGGVVERAGHLASLSGSSLSASNDPVEAVSGANVIYTDVFISMGEEHLEHKQSAFEGFQVNEELVSSAADDWVFMHCLPAHRGDEVTDGVIDSPNSIVFDQAENRMWAQMSILTLLCDRAAWETYAELMEID